MDQGWRDIACAKLDGAAMNMKKKSGLSPAFFNL